MKRIDVKDTPSSAENFELDDGRIFRVTLTLNTPKEALATANAIDVETIGYQIDKTGAFVVDDNGLPITLAVQRAKIPMSSIIDGTDSVKDGWVVDGSEVDPETTKTLKHLPKTGTHGDKVVVDDQLHSYTMGAYSRIREMRAKEVSVAVTSTMDKATIDSLIP